MASIAEDTDAVPEAFDEERIEMEGDPEIFEEEAEIHVDNTKIKLVRLNYPKFNGPTHELALCG